jgi:hypothetical protein
MLGRWPRRQTLAAEDPKGDPRNASPDQILLSNSVARESHSLLDPENMKTRRIIASQRKKVTGRW